jgi:hypothetical protein
VVTDAPVTARADIATATTAPARRTTSIGINPS